MFRIAKIYPFAIAMIIASSVADKDPNIPVIYGQCQIDEYLKYNIGSMDSYEYIFTSNRTVLDNFDYENFEMCPIESGAKFYFSSGDSCFRHRLALDGRNISKTDETHSFKPMNIAQRCEVLGICEKVENYPMVKIKNLIEDFRKMHHLEDTHFVAEDYAYRLDTQNEFCPVAVQDFQPQAGQDEKNDWYYIVNTDIHIQVIHTHVCIYTDTNRNPEAELDVPKNWEKKCVQEYYYRSFHAINWNGEIINKMFRVPSFCSCVVKENMKKKKN